MKLTNKEEVLNFYLKYRIFIFPVAIILSSITLIVFVIYPQISRLITGQETYKQTNEKSHILEVKAQELSSIDENEVKRKLNIALSSLPTEKDYTEIIGLIQLLVGKYGFDLGSLQVVTGTADKSGGSSGFIVELQLKGPKSSFSNLLNTFESTARVIKVNSLDTTLSPQGVGFVDVNMSLSVFYAPLPNALGSVDSPITKLTKDDEALIDELKKRAEAISFGTRAGADSFVPVPKGKANPFE